MPLSLSQGVSEAVWCESITPHRQGSRARIYRPPGIRVSSGPCTISYSNGWSNGPQGEDPDTALVQLAADLELDRAQFSGCLQSRKALERVLRDVLDGQGIGVRNVPAFVLFRDETPFVLVGARPIEQFAAVLQRQLKQVKVGQ